MRRLSLTRFKGITNKVGIIKDPSFLKDALNIDITNDGYIQKRPLFVKDNTCQFTDINYLYNFRGGLYLFTAHGVYCKTSRLGSPIPVSSKICRPLCDNGLTIFIESDNLVDDLFNPYIEDTSDSYRSQIDIRSTFDTINAFNSDVTYAVRDESYQRRYTRMPAGEYAAWFKGRLYCSTGHRIWYSQIFDELITIPPFNGFTMPSKITGFVVLPERAIIIGTEDGCYAFAGEEEGLRQLTFENVFKNSLRVIRGGLLGLKEDIPVAIFTSKSGVYITDGVSITNITPHFHFEGYSINDSSIILNTKGGKPFYQYILKGGKH